MARRLVELNLNQVTGVSTSVGIVGRAMKFGNLHVKATSGVSYQFFRLRDPEKFTAVVQQQTAAMAGNQVAPGHSVPPVDVATSLEKLAKLHADGVLTNEEFEAQKAKLLS